MTAAELAPRIQRDRHDLLAEQSRWVRTVLASAAVESERLTQEIAVLTARRDALEARIVAELGGAE